jgi:hypothetical protein
MPAWLLPALMAGGQALQAWGATRKPKTSAAVPADLGGLRGQSIGLLQQLLTPGAFDAGGAGQNMFFGQPSALQRQSRSGIEAFLAQPSPESRTLNTARPALEAILSGGGPQFEHDLSLANSAGGRFGSSNAILRGEAGRHAYNARTQAAGTLGVLSGQAGDADFGRLMAGASLANQDMMQRAQLLSGILGMAGGATLGLPVTQQQNGLSALGGGITDISQMLMLLPFLLGKGGGAGGGAAPGAPMGWRG